MKPCDFNLLYPTMTRVPTRSGDLVGRRHAPIEHIYFPEGGVAAFLAPGGARRPVAIGLIGSEGLIGGAALQGATHWHHDVLIRGEDSTAIRVSADALREASLRSVTLLQLLLRFAANFVVQIASNSVANLVASVEQRLTRWILLYHDRLAGDDICMTHEEISIMLGIRRASATDVLHILEGKRAIRNIRGHIVVCDRAILETIAGDIYGDAEQDYRSGIGLFGKSRPAD